MRKPLSAWEAARRYGYDMQQLEANLRLTPAERCRRHSHALAAEIALRSAARRAHAGHCREEAEKPSSAEDE